MDNKSKIEEVKKIGEKIGYGELMAIAAALWGISLEDGETLGFSGGEFIPTIDLMIKKKHRETEVISHIRQMNYIRNELDTPVKYTYSDIEKYLTYFYEKFTYDKDYVYDKILSKFSTDKTYIKPEVGRLMISAIDTRMLDSNHPVQELFTLYDANFHKYSLYRMTKRG